MAEIRDIPISRIRVRKRVRKDLGNLTPLMQSLKRYGQLNPLILNRKYELIAGHRRLECARRLGWKSLKAVVAAKVTKQEMLEIELEENVQRKELTSDELARGYGQLRKMQNPGIWGRASRRVGGFLRRVFNRSE